MNSCTARKCVALPAQPSYDFMSAKSDIPNGESRYAHFEQYILEMEVFTGTEGLHPTTGTGHDGQI